MNGQVEELEEDLKPGIEVELSMLSSVLRNPTALVCSNLEISTGEFLRTLIRQARLLPAANVDLQVKLLVVFRTMINPCEMHGGHVMTARRLSSKYFVRPNEEMKSSQQDAKRAAKVQTQRKVQNFLDECGCSDLVVDLMMQGVDKVYHEAMKLGIALLENGNRQIQESFYRRFQSGDTSQFFHNMRDIIRAGQNNLRGSNLREEIRASYIGLENME